jgi:hypothetical protein
MTERTLYDDMLAGATTLVTTGKARAVSTALLLEVMKTPGNLEARYQARKEYCARRRASKRVYARLLAGR